MFYVHRITCTKNNPETTPEVTYIPLAPGEIHQVEVGFPWGCAGLVHVQIWRGEHQVWPTNPDSSFAWNDYNDVFQEAETCYGATDHWSIRVWNDDVRHDHLIVVRIGILELRKLTLGRIAESLFGAARRR